MRVRFLGLEDLLEESLATHFSILAWRLPHIEKPSGWGRKELDRTTHTGYRMSAAEVHQGLGLGAEPA